MLKGRTKQCLLFAAPSRFGSVRCLVAAKAAIARLIHDVDFHFAIVDRMVDTPATIHQVETLAATKYVVARTAEHLIRAAEAIQKIIPTIAIKSVLPNVTNESVHSGAATKRVSADTAKELIVSSTTDQVVSAVSGSMCTLAMRRSFSIAGTAGQFVAD